MPSAAGESVRIADLVSAPHLQQVRDQLCRDGHPDIVLDPSVLEFLGSAGLAVFHQADDQLRADNGPLILHRPRPLARRVVTITGLDTVLTIQPATARSLSGDPSARSQSRPHQPKPPANEPAG